MHDKILESCIDDFATRHELEGLSLPQRFVHFVNHCVVSRSTTDSFEIEDVCTDGEGDNGIDGLAVLVEGHVVTSADEVDFFREKLGRLNVEFILVQSKSGSAFSGAEIGTFLFGVKSFFNDTLPETANDDLRDAFELKNHIYKHSVDMERAPVCSLYYASSGEWKDDPHLLSRIEGELQPLRSSSLVSDVRLHPLDAVRLRTLYRSIRNKTVCEITFDKHTILPPIDGITEAYLGIVPCTEYVKLIADADGQIQRGLFYDNVRDFQGLNPVNREIAATLSDGKASDQFVLLNNGVTVVAKSITKIGAKFKIADYQIVNGCQTSHVLYLNRAKLTDKVFLPLKLVVTNDPEVTNHVIRATNRQTEVKVEAFESLSPFHRVLEEFYNTFKEPTKKLYYERRSNQYAAAPVEPLKIVSLAMQAKAFLGMFLDEPHSTHRYYGEILASNRERMFQENHRPFPYYTSAYALSRITSLLRRGELNRWFGKFRHHLVMLLRISIAGKDVPPLNSKKMDEYCETVCQALWDAKAFDKHLQQACATIEAAMRTFGGDRRLAPRLRDFTARLIPHKKQRLRGRVKYFNPVKGFGFIEVSPQEDVHVHHSAIRNKAYSCLRVNEVVEFDVVPGEPLPNARDVDVIGG